MNAAKAMKGTQNSYLVYVAWVLLICLALLAKGCTDNNEEHLFIFKEAISLDA